MADDKQTGVPGPDPACRAPRSCSSPLSRALRRSQSERPRLAAQSSGDRGSRTPARAFPSPAPPGVSPGRRRHRSDLGAVLRRIQRRPSDRARLATRECRKKGSRRRSRSVEWAAASPPPQAPAYSRSRETSEPSPESRDIRAGIVRPAASARLAARAGDRPPAQQAAVLCLEFTGCSLGSLGAHSR